MVGGACRRSLERRSNVGPIEPAPARRVQRPAAGPGRPAGARKESGGTGGTVRGIRARRSGPVIGSCEDRTAGEPTRRRRMHATRGEKPSAQPHRAGAPRLARVPAHALAHRSPRA
ncbi:hypothetical protein KCH_19820 [Kitasatospora cheerisanensis KCTC 2395]|uniref:Uncharacterized protein n=1 Tax=Kitasatospora cheerisanensis KCTC 2395 TaxID=1348663 RepID=A0A066Z7P2_9ACTN|nr:hypothetical protein KCH_19820 [Kitasatospora cheerisanensis KCTC 2395]